MRRAFALFVMLFLLVGAAGPAAAASIPLPGRIAFVRSGTLWLREGGQERQLIEEGVVTNPRFSPDGRYLAFNRRESLWVMRPGAGVWKVAETGAPANWAPNHATLALAKADGVATIAVTDDGPGAAHLVAEGWSEPAWSPDGRFLAVVRNTDREVFMGQAEIGVVTQHGGTPRLIWQDAYRKDLWVGPAVDLKWSADGRWVAFYRMALSASIGADSNQLNVVPVQGGASTELTFGPANPDYLSWAPHGAILAFTAGGGRFAWTLKQVQLAPMPPEPPFRSLTPAGFADREPAWAPTGRYVFFIRSLAEMPARMDQPGKEQAIWRLDRKTGDLRRVPGTEQALGLVVGHGGQLLWPRGDVQRATLWAARNGQAIPVVKRVDMASSYYGQYDWAGVFAWSSEHTHMSKRHYSPSPHEWYGEAGRGNNDER